MAQVWTGLSTDFSFQNYFLYFNWISNEEKKNSELSISLSLGLKFTRLPSLNLAIEGVPSVLRVCPNSSIIFSLDLNDFF